MGEHVCIREADIARSSAHIENIQRILEEQNKRFDKIDTILEILRQGHDERNAFEQRLHGGYKLFLVVCSIVGSGLGLLSYFHTGTK